MSLPTSGVSQRRRKSGGKAPGSLDALRNALKCRKTSQFGLLYFASPQPPKARTVGHRHGVSDGFSACELDLHTRGQQQKHRTRQAPTFLGCLEIVPGTHPSFCQSSGIQQYASGKFANSVNSFKDLVHRKPKDSGVNRRRTDSWDDVVFQQLSSIRAPARLKEESNAESIFSDDSHSHDMISLDTEAEHGDSQEVSLCGTNPVDFYYGHMNTPVDVTYDPDGHAGDLHASARSIHDQSFLRQPGQAARMRSGGRLMEIQEDISDSSGSCLEHSDIISHVGSFPMENESNELERSGRGVSTQRVR